ncbi:MAG: helix-turn-helix domain-containing protein [Rhodomicrobium sp.]
MLAEVRMARIVDAIGRVRGGALSCVEAAALLGVSERHFRRLRDAYLDGGAEAIIDKRRGRPASNKVAAAIEDWVVEQYRTRYFDFTAKHFHEALKRDGFRYGYTWTKSVLYLRGLLKPAEARGPASQKTSALTLAGHAGVSGRLDARLVLGPAGALRSHRHARRCGGGDLIGLLR